MLDVILELIGGALLLGQALHFCFFADPAAFVGTVGRSILPATGNVPSRDLGQEQARS